LELGAHDSIGSGDVLDDPLERPDVIDPDGVEHDGDECGETGEIGENAPNEPNFDETMSIEEPQEAIQVTANSGTPSRLDNGAAQPGDGSTREDGKAPGSGSASGDPEPQMPDSSDRTCGKSSPATVSEPEKRRLRQEERRAVERMVEDKLSAGDFAPGEILMSALALPLSRGRGP